MPTYTFQWSDEKGVRHRMDCTSTEEDYAWVKALQKCGWSNRTSLGIIGDNKALQIRDGVIKNWFQAMDDRKLHKFNTLYLSFNLQDQLKSGFVKLVEV